jgi:hypothetical protein
MSSGFAGRQGSFLGGAYAGIDRAARPEALAGSLFCHGLTLPNLCGSKSRWALRHRRASKQIMAHDTNVSLAKNNQNSRFMVTSSACSLPQSNRGAAFKFHLSPLHYGIVITVAEPLQPWR